MLTIRSGEPGALLRYWQRGHASNSKSQDLKTHQQNAANTNGLSHWPAPRPVVGCYGAYFQSALPVAMVQVSEALGLRPQLWLLWCKFPASPTRTYCNHQRSTAQLTINHRLQPITKPACSPLRCPPTSPTPSPDHKPAHHPHRAPIHQRTRHAIQRTPL